MEPEEAYPVCYPDMGLDGHPCLPPVHPDWTQEKENIIEWFDYKWGWYRPDIQHCLRLNNITAFQGGQGKPDWERISNEINDGSYKTIALARLPARHLPFPKPEDWDQNQTVMWSNILRESMDTLGRPDPDRLTTAFQFYRIDGADGSMSHEDIEFRKEIHQDSPLRYGFPAMYYDGRVDKYEESLKRGKAPAANERRARLVLSPPCETLVHKAAARVPNLQECFDLLVQYEGTNAPEVRN